MTGTVFLPEVEKKYYPIFFIQRLLKSLRETKVEIQVQLQAQVQVQV